ncbi:MAG TPA: hypothetical protein VN310_00170 [Candidatus Dormibacteraeota bacterium]|jgi:hypothetical protein|nr:hypothetical protein [Candidatus Dormibacteraeota bacterium]
MTCTSTPRFSRRALLFIAITSAASFALCAPAQDLAKRLILKDGSYQSVTKYEVKGDRVRYKSAERDEWEELPSALVDWSATEKYEKDRAASAIPEAKALDKETDAERAAEESHLPQVAPGLRLPEASGVFLLDNFQGQPQLVEMQQLEGDLNRNTRGNIFRGAMNPIASAKQSVELQGEHATLHAHVSVPSIYINVDEQDRANPEPPEGETASAKPSQPSLDAPRAKPQGPQQPQQPQQPEQALIPFDRFRIVRAKVKGGKRIVGDLKRNVAGKVSQNENFVKTTITRVSGGWLKLTPTEDLAPGEYALVEMKGSEGMNLYVWDFGVNPNGPANANPWKPEEKAAEAQKPKGNL